MWCILQSITSRAWGCFYFKYITELTYEMQSLHPFFIAYSALLCDVFLPNNKK
jgi:hypothetical protein